MISFLWKPFFKCFFLSKQKQLWLSTVSFLLFVNCQDFQAEIVKCIPLFSSAVSNSQMSFFYWLPPKAGESSLRCYFHHSTKDKWIHAFHKEIYARVNVFCYHRVYVDFCSSIFLTIFIVLNLISTSLHTYYNGVSSRQKWKFFTFFQCSPSCH